MTDHGPMHAGLDWNADEWHLFLCQHCDSRATSPNGLNTVALKIADTIDQLRRVVPTVAMYQARVKEILDLTDENDRLRTGPVGNAGSGS